MNIPYPNNDADTDKPILEVFKKRWSPIAFSSDPVSREDIETLFEAARWTQSSYNEQPWRFIYATKGEPDFEKLSGLLGASNQYASSAYILILGSAVLRFKRNNEINRHAQYDTGAAMNSIFLQAVGMGLVAHEMGGFDKERAISELGILQDVEPMAMMAVGYPGDPEGLTPELKEKQNKKRTRKELTEIAFEGKWPN